MSRAVPLGDSLPTLAGQRRKLERRLRAKAGSRSPLVVSARSRERGALGLRRRAWRGNRFPLPLGEEGAADVAERARVACRSARSCVAAFLRRSAPWPFCEAICAEADTPRTSNGCA